MCAHGVEPGPAAAPVCTHRRPVGLTSRLLPKRGVFLTLSYEVADEAVCVIVPLLPSSLKEYASSGFRSRSQSEAVLPSPCSSPLFWQRAHVPPPHEDRQRCRTSRRHSAGAALPRAAAGQWGPRPLAPPCLAPGGSGTAGALAAARLGVEMPPSPRVPPGMADAHQK